MRRAQGYGSWVDKETGKTAQEADTVQCCHCQTHIFVKPLTATTVYLIYDKATRRWKEEPGAWCRRCNAPVCLPCHAKGTCEHFLREIERQESMTAARDALARLGRFHI